MSRTQLVVHVYILDIAITYTNDSVFCPSECEDLHRTVTVVVFFLKIMKFLFKKREHSRKCTESSHNETRIFVLTGLYLLNTHAVVVSDPLVMLWLHC